MAQQTAVKPNHTAGFKGYGPWKGRVKGRWGKWGKGSEGKRARGKGRDVSYTKQQSGYATVSLVAQSIYKL